MIANAQLVKVIILLVWGSYLVINLKLKTVLLALIAAGLILGAMAALNISGAITEKPTTFVDRLFVQAQSPEAVESYLAGDYARFAAIIYFIKSDILWLGDGPSAYFDVFTRERSRGNTGHIFTFYSEVGLLGWLLSVGIFFLIAFPGRKWRLKISWTQALMFISINILAFTSEVMNDIAVMLMYCIMARVYLLEPIETSKRSIYE